MTYSTGNPIYDRGTESAISIATQPREVLATQIENRYQVMETQKRQGTVNAGDFDGAVQGKFLKWNTDGAVIVEFNNKQYKTKPLGFTAIPRGSTVELTYVSGIYCSKW